MFLKRIVCAAAPAGADRPRAGNGHRAAARGVRAGDMAFVASTGELVLTPVRVA